MKNKVLKRALVVLTVCLHQHMCVYRHHKDSREAGKRSCIFTKTMTLKLNYTSILVQSFARRFTHQMENRATSGYLAGVNFASWHQCKHTLLAHMLIRTNGFGVSWKLFVRSDFLCAASEVDVSARAAAS